MKKILVGAGANGLRMFEHFGDENVHCFADNYKTGSIRDKEIISVDELCDIWSDFEVVITPDGVPKLDLIKQLTEKGIKFFSPRSETFEISRQISDEFASEFHYEGHFTEYLVESLRDAEFFIDAGAEYGHYTRLARYYAKDVQVFALEPDVRKYDSLVNRFGSDDSVKIINCAVSNVSGEIELYSIADSEHGGKVQNSYTIDPNLSLHTFDKVRDNPANKKTTITVKAVTLDEIIPPPFAHLVLSA